MILGGSDAVAGLNRVIALEGGKGFYSIYAVVLGHLAARLNGDETEGKAILERTRGTLNVEAWPYPVVKLFRGEIDEQALLAAADDDDKRTDARCFLGLDHAIKGHEEKALADFRWVRDHGNSNSLEHIIAVAQLERLEQKAAKSPFRGN